MAVQLSIVGIFFDQSIATDHTKSPYQVSEIMKAVKAAPPPGVSAFTYGIDENLDATYFSATYNAGFTSKGHKAYQAGQYYLAQNLAARPSYTVWQYYVLDANKQPINYARLSFTNAQVVVPDGGSITWRLVSILAGQNAAASHALTARQQRTLV